MIGAIAGDIIGSIYEFDKDCFFTDDSVMTIAVAKALMKFDEISENFLSR